MESSERSSTHNDFPTGESIPSPWEMNAAKIVMLVKPYIEDFIEQKIFQMNLDVYNAQELPIAKPYILVANHPKPIDRVSLATGTSPDSFILHHIVKKTTGADLRFLGHYGIGAAPFIESFPHPVQTHWKEIHKGMMKGYGALAIDTTPGSIPRDFVRGAKEIINHGDPILIYPYGDWHEDEELVGNVQRGATYLSRKLQIPLVPAFINGARTWKTSEKTSVAFGSPFEITQVTDKDATDLLQQKILDLSCS